MKRLYHLHIPRTSGLGICHSLWRTFNNNGLPSDAFSPDVSTLMYDHEAMIEYPFISGHFAKNPIIESEDDLNVFSLVREPVEHFLSIAAYVSKSAGRKMSNEYMDEFLYGNITPFGVNELFSNSGNIQAKMLFCRIAFVDKSLVALSNDDVQNEKNIVFIEADIPDEEKIKDTISSMNLFALKDRGKAIGWLQDAVLESHGFALDDTVYDVVNSSEMNGFRPDIFHMREIEKRSEIDNYVYRLVSEK